MAKKKVEEFPNLRLGDLFRLSVFVADNMFGPAPTSMRAIMKGSGSSHRKMGRTLDAVESTAQELIVYRYAINPDGTRGRILDSYEEAMHLDKEKEAGIEGAKGTVRITGAITPYARIWYLYGEIVGSLYNDVAHTQTPSAMEHELTKIIAALKLKGLKTAPLQSDGKTSET